MRCRGIVAIVVFALGSLIAHAGVGQDERPARAESERARTAPDSAVARVLFLEISGSINPATADYIHDGLAIAREQGGTALLIQLDTPGGLLDSTKTIVKDLLGADVPVIVFVGPAGAGATSAGVFVTLAAHVAAMAPGTSIGAAHPVGGQGETISGDMAEKVENFAASLSRTIAQQRGRNAEWAEKAVRESVSITEREALKLKVIDVVAADVTELLAKISGREVALPGRKVSLATAGAILERHEMRLRQKVLNVLGNPNLAYLLLMAGILGLYVEFTSPGVLFPGVAGAICLLLALAALQVLPINYTGLALILLGAALLVAELFLPSFGIVGIGGMVAFVLGSLLLFDTPDSNVRVDRGIVAAAAATLGGVTLAVGWLVVRSQRRPSAVGLEGMVGEVGEVRRGSDASGRVKVFVHGEYWDATADESLDIGVPVEVVRVDGLQMHVRRHRRAPRGAVS